MNGGESPLSSWQDEPAVPGYTSRGARLLQAVMRRHSIGPAIVNVDPRLDLIAAEAIELLSLIDQPAYFIEEGA